MDDSGRVPDRLAAPEKRIVERERVKVYHDDDLIPYNQREP